MPINQDTSTGNSNTRPADCTNTVTSPAGDAFVEPSTELADHLLQPVYPDLSQNLTMAADAASYIDQGALQ